jgi:hypothetical protein
MPKFPRSKKLPVKGAGQRRGIQKASRVLKYQVAGKTSDGVTILRAKVGPKHFASQEIRDAISEVAGPTSAVR